MKEGGGLEGVPGVESGLVVAAATGHPFRQPEEGMEKPDSVAVRRRHRTTREEGRKDTSWDVQTMQRGGEGERDVDEGIEMKTESGREKESKQKQKQK